MCETIRIKNGIDIRTVKEFKEYFKVELPKYDNSDEIIEDGCLCQIDLYNFMRNNTNFEYICGDWWEYEST
jgi:hypothetical protein